METKMETKKKNHIEFIFPKDMKQDMKDMIEEKALEPFITEASNNLKNFFDQYKLATATVIQLNKFAKQIKRVNKAETFEFINHANNFNKAMISFNKSLKEIIHDDKD